MGKSGKMQKCAASEITFTLPPESAAAGCGLGSFKMSPLWPLRSKGQQYGFRADRSVIVAGQNHLADHSIGDYLDGGGGSPCHPTAHPILNSGRRGMALAEGGVRRAMLGMRHRKEKEGLAFVDKRMEVGRRF